MIYIVAVRIQSPGTHPEHVVEVIWVNAKSFASGRSSVAAIIEWIDKKNGQAKVTDGSRTAEIEIVRPAGRKPYIKTKGDTSKTDNLLALPQFQ